MPDEERTQQEQTAGDSAGVHQVPTGSAPHPPAVQLQIAKDFFSQAQDKATLERWWGEQWKSRRDDLGNAAFGELRDHVRGLHQMRFGGNGVLAEPETRPITPPPADVETYTEEQEDVPVSVFGDERQALADRHAEAQMELERLETDKAEALKNMNKGLKDQRALVRKLAHQYSNGITFKNLKVRVEKDFKAMEIRKFYADTGEPVVGYPMTMTGEELQRSIVPEAGAGAEQGRVKRGRPRKRKAADAEA